MRHLEVSVEAAGGVSDDQGLDAAELHHPNGHGTLEEAEAV
jgi:hypothetical protein